VSTEEEVSYARDRALRDTGYLAREFLGFNYDKHWKTGERSPGGLREDGPHKLMIDVLDAPTQNKLIMGPRGCLKTTALQAFCVRKIVENPNIRIHYVMATYDEAKKTVEAVKEHFETNEKIRDMFGSFKGVGTEKRKWADNGFTVSKRTATGLREPTMWAGGTDKNSTGGHCDILILDDLVNWQNVRTSEGIQKSIDCFRANQPLLDPGGILIVTCTLYDDADLSSLIRNELRDMFDILVLDSGVDIVRSNDGKLELIGEPVFKHQPMEFLRQKFATMSPADFSRQYLNKSLASGMALFRRTHFHPARWERWMESLSLYIVTDTATGASDESCYSVIGVIGLDVENRSYLCDLRVGNHTPAEFVTTFVDVVAKWQQKANLRGALLERIGLNMVFRPQIMDALRVRDLRVHIIDVARGGGGPSKEQRIKRLHRRFEDGNFFVLDTVPRTYNDLGDVKSLWDPSGFVDPDGIAMPDGELVREFIRFPVYPKNDIADAIADIDAMDSEGQRLCVGTSRATYDRLQNERKRRGNVVPMHMMVNGRPEVVNAIQPKQARTSGGNIWSDLAKRIPG